jgi:hypothetical protein
LLRIQWYASKAYPKPPGLTRDKIAIHPPISMF